MDVFTMITKFLGGIGLFLFGMDVMSVSLQKLAGSKMKQILSILTKNRLLGVLTGAGITCLIQSSSATTVMLVGFVNAGLMTLSQSVGVIMGANIGTTVTGWLVSAVEWASFLKPEALAPVAVGIGAFYNLFAQKDHSKQIGGIIVGFGMLFVGIAMMSEGVEPLKDLPAFAEAFTTFGSNPVLGILIGTVVTAIIQSSSASVGILQSLALSGLVTWNSAVYIIMGQNIGTCITAVLSSIGASKNAKGVAYVHLLFNIVGSIIFSVVAVLFFTFVNSAMGFEKISSTEISLVHTMFNIGCTVLFFPFANLFVKAAELFLNKRKVEEDETCPVHLDDRIIKTPAVAIESCVKEICRLGRLSYKNLMLSYDAMMEQDKDKMEQVLVREKNIDTLTSAITRYMVKLCNANITAEENTQVTALFHTVTDMERIGDYCENLVELTQFMVDDSLAYSDRAKTELKNMFDETIKCVDNALKSLENNSLEYAEKVVREEERIDMVEKQLRSEHIERLARNACDPMVGVVYVDVLTNLERISDHALNVAQMVMGVEK